MEIDGKIVVAFGAISAAMIAGFISFAGMLIAKDNKTTEFRQEWINSLRDEIATLLSLSQTVWALKNINESIQNNRSESEALDHLVTVVEGSSKEMSRCRHKIKLLLNKDEHAELINNLDKIFKESSDSKHRSTKELNKLISDFTSKTQDHLKFEWERVKSGEITYRRFKWGSAIFVAVALCMALIYITL